MEFKPKNEDGTNTGNRLFAGIVAVCEPEGQPKVWLFAQLQITTGNPN